MGSLEAFVFRVKTMITVNWNEAGRTGAKMSHTFWVGNLKNRDLKGAEIVEPIEEKEKSIQSDEDEDEENVLPEEDQSDVELSDVESEGNGKSNAGRKHKALDSSSDSEEEIDEDVIGETDEEAMAVDT